MSAPVKKAIPLLPATSITITLDFYKALGAVVTYQQKAPNNYIALKLDDIELHFFGLKQLKPEANFSTCYLVVDKIDELYETCRTGLKHLHGKIPLKGIPRINQLKDMPTYGVRQFVLVDPSGNYIRIGQPIEKVKSVLFEENGIKPQKASPLTKAYELADRLVNGKDDPEAAIKVLDKVLAGGPSEETGMVFKLITLRMELAYQIEDTAKIKQLYKRGKSLLKELAKNKTIAGDLKTFTQIAKELDLT